MPQDDSPFDATKVDLVTEDPDGVVILVIVQPRAWAGTDGELVTLLDKIHSYVGFALDGQLTTLYPDTAGRPWRIEIESQVESPPASVAERLERVKDRVREHGGDLHVRSTST